MPANQAWPRRLWTNYFTTQANTNEQFFQFLTDEEFKTRYIETVFVGIATKGVQFGMKTGGTEFSTVDCTRFAAGDAVLHVDVDVRQGNPLYISLKNRAGAALTDVPVVIGYRVDPSQGNV